MSSRNKEWESFIFSPVGIMALTLMVLIIIGSTSLSWAKRSVEKKQNMNATETRKEVTTPQRTAVYLDTLEKTYNFMDYRSVNWKLYQDEGRPYPCDFDTGGISKELFAKAAKEFSGEFYCEIWSQLANAKEDFHNVTSKIRVIASESVLNKVNNVEQGFNDVFTRLLEDYYSRAFIDHYNDIMKARFSELEGAMKLEILNGWKEVGGQKSNNSTSVKINQTTSDTSALETRCKNLVAQEYDKLTSTDTETHSFFPESRYDANNNKCWYKVSYFYIPMQGYTIYTYQYIQDLFTQTFLIEIDREIDNDNKEYITGDRQEWDDALKVYNGEFR